MFYMLTLEQTIFFGEIELTPPFPSVERTCPSEIFLRNKPLRSPQYNFLTFRTCRWLIIYLVINFPIKQEGCSYSNP